MTNRIEGHARTVSQLLRGARYTIDFFQREYAWKDGQARGVVDQADANRNKVLFDAQYGRRNAIGAEFGGPLGWERLDDKRPSRIRADVDGGGWANEATWHGACERAQRTPCSDSMRRWHPTCGS